MKKVFFIILILLLFLLPTSGFALTAEAVADAPKAEIEDIVRIEVDFREDNIGAVFATFTYDPQLLEYIEGEGTAAANGHGTMVLYASGSNENRLQTVLKFRAKNMGSAKIFVDVKEALSFDEKKLDPVSVSAEVRLVRPADAYVIVDVQGERMHALCTPPYIPNGYTEKTIRLAEKSVTAAVSGDNVFVYLTEPDSDNGSYYLRDNGTYLPAAVIHREYILLPIAEDAVPEGFSPALLDLGDSAYNAYTNGTHYLVYAINESGNHGLYLYDLSEKTLQLYNDDIFSVPEYIDVPVTYDYTRVMVLAIIFILLLVGIIVVAIIKSAR